MKLNWRDAIGFIIFVTLAALAGYNMLIGIPFAENIFDVATKLVGALIVITAFVERTTAVIGSIWFDDDIDKASAEENSARKALKDKPEDTERLNKLSDSSMNLATWRAKKSKMRLYLSLFMALAVSAVGVRTLGSLLLIDTPKLTVTAFQRCFYYTADIVITAGLIAGGSKGLIMIADLISTIIQHTKEKLLSK
ncbi:MAG: hypothetical protein HZB23_15465 [Deltaproteobacteria bacterium]|nr:hypothetical protein [Deltaproteobacteria bacterium]